MRTTMHLVLIVFLVVSYKLDMSYGLIHSPTSLLIQPNIFTRPCGGVISTSTSSTCTNNYHSGSRAIIRHRSKSTTISPLSWKSTSSNNNDETTSSNVTISSILNASLLISGTTIGGGFLALPTVTQPIGFIPSSITLFGVWIYFLFQSFILVEAIQRTRQEHYYYYSKQVQLVQNRKSNLLLHEYDDQEQKQDQEQDQKEQFIDIRPGVSTVAGNVFGRKGQIIVGILLTILIEATLVSQISRAGLMMNNNNSNLFNYKLGCALSSLSIAMLVFGPKKRGVEFASNINSLLTIGFLCSVVSVLSCGVQYADWSRLGITGTVPVASSSSSYGGIETIFGNIFNIIPTFLQLLVYGEIVPCVCELLQYKTKSIRFAILLGSFLTLCLQIGWSGLGISMINSSIAPSGSNDVVNMLLQQGGMVRVPLLCLSATAILTTILGSYLALLTMFNGIYVNISSKRNLKNTNTFISKSMNMNTEEEISRPYISLRQRLIVGSMITLPALCIASTSPSMFLKAIDFAGSYPVLLLWGILPPIMVLIQRFRQRKNNPHSLSYTRDTVTSSGPFSWLLSLILLSTTYFGMNAKIDVILLLKKLTRS